MENDFQKASRYHGHADDVIQVSISQVMRI